MKSSEGDRGNTPEYPLNAPRKFEIRLFEDCEITMGFRAFAAEGSFPVSLPAKTSCYH